MKTEDTIINILLDAGSGNAVESREGRVGEPYGALPTPKRSGYHFDGWYRGDQLITAETVVESEEDVSLTARWSRKAQPKNKHTSSLKRQKYAIIALAVVAVALIITWAIVSQLIATYSLVDTYTKDGVEYSDRYIIKREDGVYKLFDTDGNRMLTNNIDEDVFITPGSGNQYRIDPETGAYKLKAVVIPEDQEGIQGTTLLLFPQITSQYLYAVEVKRESDSYKFYNTPSGVMLEGYEKTLVEYDEKLYAKLCLATGWAAASRKLTAASDVAKKEDGSIDYAVYGLEKPTTVYTIQGVLFKKDADGNILYEKNAPVIDYATGVDEDGEEFKSYKPDPDHCYTVKIGDMTPSKTGYYAQLEGSANIYILSASYISETVMQPIEALVVPKAVHSVSVNMHNMVNGFYLTHLPEWDSDKVSEGELIVYFRYEDLEARENTLYTTHPYLNLGNALMEGYEINSTTASNALGALYGMQYLSCVKLDKNVGSRDVLAEFGLDKDIYYLRYGVDMNESDGIKSYMENHIIIGREKNANGNYYVASLTYSMIVEVAPAHLPFMSWSSAQWYEENFLRQNISYLKDLVFEIGDKIYDIDLDNALSYAYYLESKTTTSGETVQVLTSVDSSSGYLTQEGNKTVYKTTDGGIYDVILLDLNTVEVLSYRDAMLYPDKENILYTDIVYYYSDNGENYSVEYDFSSTKVIHENGEYYYVGYWDGEEVGRRRAYVLNAEKGTYYYLDSSGQRVEITLDNRTADIVHENGAFYYRVYKDGKMVEELKVTRQFEEPIYRYKSGMEASVMVASDFLSIAANGESLDYTVRNTYRDDTGVERVESITARDNFRRLYTQILYFSLEGDVDPKEFLEKTGKTIDEFLAGPHTADAAITISIEDYASILNAYTYFSNEKNEETGETVETEHIFYTENNTKNLVVRFYRYSDWKALVTIETFEIGEDGAPVYSEAGESGKFFVNYNYLQKLQESFEQLLNQEIIPE